MNFNLFSSKKKNKKTDVSNATDFLNPADLKSAEGLEKPKKFRREKGKSKGLEAKIKIEEKKIEEPSKVIEPSDKKEVKKEVKLDNKVNSKQIEKVKEDSTRVPKEKPTNIEDKKEIEEIISQFEKERQTKLNKKNKGKLPEKVKEDNTKAPEEKPINIEDKKIDNLPQSELKTTQKKASTDSIFVKNRIQELNKGSDRGDFFNQDKILEINLVKDQISVFFDWYKNLAFLFIFIFLSFLFIVEVYWALSWWQNYNQNSSNYNHNSSSLVSLSQEIRGIKGSADEALAFEKQMSRVAYLLDNHIYWTEFFNYLEDNTLEGVKYSSFTGDLNGKYSLNSVADDYPLVGRQAQRYFSSDLSKDVSVDSASLQMQSKKIIVEGPDGEMIEGEEAFSNVSFVIDLEISPEIFKK